MKDKQKIGKSVPTGIYVRVSTEDQAQEGFSIRAQIEKLKAYALLKDWEIYDIYSDEGISGKNIVDRPQMNRLIDDIENGKVKNVLVFKVDRLTRSTRNLIELVDLFEENKCTFNSLTEMEQHANQDLSAFEIARPSCRSLFRLNLLRTFLLLKNKFHAFPFFTENYFFAYH